MLTFLFWNLNKKPIAHHVVRLALHHHVDVLMLAESTLNRVTLLSDLNTGSLAPYAYQPSERKKIDVFSLPSAGGVVEQFVDGPGSVTVRRLDLPAHPSILLAVTHLPSK